MILIEILAEVGIWASKMMMMMVMVMMMTMMMMKMIIMVMVMIMILIEILAKVGIESVSEYSNAEPKAARLSDDQDYEWRSLRGDLKVCDPMLDYVLHTSSPSQYSRPYRHNSHHCGSLCFL